MTTKFNNPWSGESPIEYVFQDDLTHDFGNKMFERQREAVHAKVRNTIVRLELLDWRERTLSSIEGFVTTGSMSISGDSAIRRTINLTFLATEDNYRVLENYNQISINKKLRAWIGIQNLLSTNQEPVWFKLGVYVMTSPNVSLSPQGWTISIQAQDKMCLHSGEVGGIIPAATVIDSENIEMAYTSAYQALQTAFLQARGASTLSATDAANLVPLVKDLQEVAFGAVPEVDYKIERILQLLAGLGSSANSNSVGQVYYEISPLLSDLGHNLKTKKIHIKEIVEKYCAMYGQESPGKILVDVPRKIKIARRDKRNGDSSPDSCFSYGENVIGRKVVIGANTPVVKVYEECNAALGGNYEFFYDIDGNFRFQEKRNYMYNDILTTHSNTIFDFDKIKSSNYHPNFEKTSVQYNFSDDNIVSSYQNAPQWNNIKNDFYIYGVAGDDTTRAEICYHLAIDEKPIVPAFVSTFYPANVRQVLKLPSGSAPTRMDWREWLIHSYRVGMNHTFVGKYTSSTEDDLKAYFAQDDIKAILKDLLSPIVLLSATDNNALPKYYPYNPETNSIDTTSPLDLAKVIHAESMASVYYTELESRWRSDRFNQSFFPYLEPREAFYQLDIISGDAYLDKFSIPTIGRRSFVISDENIKKMYIPPVEDRLIYFNDDDIEYLPNKDDYEKIKITDPDQLDNFPFATISGDKDAIGVLRKALFDKTHFNEQVTLTTLPIYYLEPNVRVFVYSDKASIQGYFLIKSINFSFSEFGAMTINLTKAQNFRY